MYIGLDVKCPLFFSNFNENWIFLNRLSKNTQISNIMHILPAGVEFFVVDRREDGRTDRHEEADSRFSQFCERA